jgi:TPR repeat protein
VGDGIPIDKVLDSHYGKLAVDQGHAQAQFNYGFLLVSGDGIPMDKSLGRHYFKPAADQGHAQAEFN